MILGMLMLLAAVLGVIYINARAWVIENTVDEIPIEPEMDRIIKIPGYKIELQITECITTTWYREYSADIKLCPSELGLTPNLFRGECGMTSRIHICSWSSLLLYEKINKRLGKALALATKCQHARIHNKIEANR